MDSLIFTESINLCYSQSECELIFNPLFSFKCFMAGGSFKVTAKNFVCLIVVGGVFFGEVKARLCKASCDINKCQHVGNCLNGIVLDSCECCEVCAKQLNDTCGGPHDIYGKCGDNLRCTLVFLENGQPITGNEKGICQEISSTVKQKCNEFTCEESGTLICPYDSRLSTEIDPKSAGCCVNETVLSCQCDNSTCQTSDCRVGSKPEVVEQAAGRPGRCCDITRCTPVDTNIKCISNEKVYQNNDTWFYACKTCTCQEGVKVCHPQACPGLLESCGWMVYNEGHCCPICKGCLSIETHQLYNNSDQWQKDKCTRCECVSGQTHCVSETCLKLCDNPTYLPDRCCPVCNLSTTTTVSINKDKCHLFCLHGREVNEKGIELCRCKPEYKCEPLIGCKKDCIYGFRKSRYGCNKCKCNRCPPFRCTKKCLHGFLISDRGCEICKCKVRKSPTVTLKYNDRQCVSTSGYSHEDGETWHDGCRQCFCNNGKEMCYLIRCKQLTCTNPVVKLGDCCPSCPGQVIIGRKLPMVEQCFSVDGHHFTEGETWRMDVCTSCICHQGLILCETQVCPPVLCHYPIRHKSKCCPVCKDSERDSNAIKSGRSCYSAERITYKHGDTWRVNPCQSCACKFGHIHCYSQTCSPVKCGRLTLRKGQCCPICLDESRVKACEQDSQLYSVGEEWQSHCSLCACQEGGVIHCVNMTCPYLKCFVLVRKPSTCCPVCLEDSGYSLAIRNVPDHTHADTTNHAGHQNGHHLMTVAVLAVLFSLAFIAVIILTLIQLRRQHSCLFRSANELATISARQPALKNDYHHTGAFLRGIKPFSNYERGTIPETSPLSELLHTDDRWHNSTTDTSVSSTA